MTTGERNGIERHIQTLVLAIVAGLVGWVGVNVSGMLTRVALLEQHTAQLSIAVTELKQQSIVMMDDRYRGSDARRDLSERDKRISDNERRLSGLEGRVGRLEGGPR